jgi:type VI secretion system protein ImpI
LELAPVTLILTIENRQSLPNGVPVSVTLSNGRGLEIGRNENLDWTLPDPFRIVSGKHCEVRCRDGAYWLHDVSTNGTFLNDNPRRIQTPYRLRHGDRLLIGPYVIGVAIVEDESPLP